MFYNKHDKGNQKLDNIDQNSAEEPQTVQNKPIMKILKGYFTHPSSDGTYYGMVVSFHSLVL